MLFQKFTIVVCAICFLLLSACDAHNYLNGVNNGDWEYALPNGYVIWHVNSQSIVCGKKHSEHSISHVTDDYVKSFSYDDEYILLQCIIDNQNNNNPIKYYIIKAQTDEIIGPLSEYEYSEYITGFDIISSHWIDTNPTPKGVVYK